MSFLYLSKMTIFKNYLKRSTPNHETPPIHPFNSSHNPARLQLPNQHRRGQGRVRQKILRGKAGREGGGAEGATGRFCPRAGEQWQAGGTGKGRGAF